MFEPSADLLQTPAEVQLLFHKGDHRWRQLRRTPPPLSSTFLRADLRQVVVAFPLHLVSSPFTPDGGTVNFQLTRYLRIGDAPFREDLNMHKVIQTQTLICCQNAPPVA
jgi:hypothetical protein